jgi:hypothetical protein
MANDTNEQQVRWRPHDWLKAAGHPFSLPVLYNEIRAGRLDARKVAGGKNMAILTSPREYFAKMPRGIGPAVKRKKAVAA